jgi:hypothetical protein
MCLARIFQIHGRVFIKTNNIHHLEGQGRYHVNPTGKIVTTGGTGLGVEDYRFPGGHNDFFLERYDLHEIITIDSKNRSDCRTESTPGANMRNPWNWLVNATYDGRRGHSGNTVDVWNNTFTDPSRGAVTLAVAVLTHDPSRPVFFGRKHVKGGAFQEMGLEIEQWDTRTPDNNEFQVPRECGKGASPVKPLSKSKGLFRRLIK